MVDQISEQFKQEDGKKVNKRAFKAVGSTIQAKAKAAKTGAVDMSGINTKPVSEEPTTTSLIVEANMLNLPNCKLVIRGGGVVYVKNTGDTKVFGILLKQTLK